jgi:3-oxoacyl-[acyl-carrier protein] reductase
MEITNLLKGQTIAITGASKGIGKEIALLMASAGANLVLMARTKDLLGDLQKEITEKYSVKVVCYALDVSSQEEIVAVFKDLASQQILIDCLVNNAGIMVDAMLQVVKPDLIKSIYETNVFAVMNLSQLAMKSMLRKRKGSIINLASIIGTNGNAGQVVYGSSKAAVIGITKSLAKELAPFNIRVNAVAPGFIDTDMTRGMDVKFKEKNIASIGMKRFGKPEDVARVVVFLASDLSEYVTGQVIGVDGAMII